MSNYYTLAGHVVSRFEDLYELPCLVHCGDGILEAGGQLIFRIVEGRLVDPQQNGDRIDEIPDENIYAVQSFGPLRGWGKHDCDHSYFVAGYVVSGDLMDRFAEMVNLQPLPVAS